VADYSRPNCAAHDCLFASLQYAVGNKADTAGMTVEPGDKLLQGRLLQVLGAALVDGQLVTPPIAGSLLIGKQQAWTSSTDENKLRLDLRIAVTSRA